MYCIATSRGKPPSAGVGCSRSTKGSTPDAARNRPLIGVYRCCKLLSLSGIGALGTLSADVIGISVDSAFAQEAWANQHKIGIKIVSDLNKETTKAYDVLFPMLAGVGDTSARAAFVIDKNGVVQYAEQTPTPKDLPNFEAVKAVLAGLK